MTNNADIRQSIIEKTEAARRARRDQQSSGVVYVYDQRGRLVRIDQRDQAGRDD